MRRPFFHVIVSLFGLSVVAGAQLPPARSLTAVAVSRVTLSKAPTVRALGDPPYVRSRWVILDTTGQIVDRVALPDGASVAGFDGAASVVVYAEHGGTGRLMRFRVDRPR